MKWSVFRNPIPAEQPSSDEQTDGLTEALRLRGVRARAGERAETEEHDNVVFGRLRRDLHLTVLILPSSLAGFVPRRRNGSTMKSFHKMLVRRPRQIEPRKM